LGGAVERPRLVSSLRTGSYGGRPVILLQVVIGSVIMVVTAVIHAAGQSVGLRWLFKAHAMRLQTISILTRSLIVGALVLVMFLATLIEATVWAATYLALGAISEFEKALYFSTVTYTTLGYGDVVLESQWRLLSSFEAANGVITASHLRLHAHYPRRDLNSNYSLEKQLNSMMCA